MLKVLDDEARLIGVSINALVNIILRRFSEFSRFLSKVDMVVINREILTLLLDSLDEERIVQVGKRLGETVMPDTIMFWKKEISEEAVLEYIEKVTCKYGQLGTFDEMLSQNGRTIVIRHRLGAKGSAFLQAYLSAGLQKTIGAKAFFETTESSVKCEIKSN